MGCGTTDIVKCYFFVVGLFASCCFFYSLQILYSKVFLFLLFVFFMFRSITTVACLDDDFVFYVISRALEVISTGYDADHDCW